MRPAPRPAPALPSGDRYKVAEVAPVDERALEDCLNEWTAQGYRLEAIHFVVSEASRRPTMAFVLFTEPAGQARRPRRRA
jgi:hypothetical protein